MPSSLKSVDSGNAARADDTDTLHRRWLRELGEDPTAFRQLYRHFKPRVTGLARRMVQSEETVEEVANDTLYTVWEKAGDFAGRSRVSTWIFGIAYRKSLKALDRRGPQLQSLDEETMNRYLVSEDSVFAAQAAREDRRRLEAHLQALPPAMSSVVYMTFYLGMSYPEIAEVLEVPHNTVKTRMFHARARLRDLVEREHDDDPTGQKTDDTRRDGAKPCNGDS